MAAVEQSTAKADFSFLEADNAAPSAEALRILVQRIAEIEQKLNTICPPGIYQQTGAKKYECLPERIQYFEQRLASLPIWEHVHFLHWLGGLYRQRREELTHAVSQQLIEAESNLKTMGGYPFPISPLTIPLKVIFDELQTPLNTGTLTSRGAIPVPGYPQPVNMYIFLGNYADGWQRLEALGGLIEESTS